MKLSLADHEAHPWRIREIAPDFTVEDVWALPVRGRAEDFRVFVDLFTAGNPAITLPAAARVLFLVRDLLGRLLDLGSISETETTRALPIPGTHETTLAIRLPAELQHTADDVHFSSLPFVPLFFTHNEFAAELSNKTVHGVLHLAWVEHIDGTYAGQMAVYVKPRGRLGSAYMAFIKPFRYAIVYPALLRHLGRIWTLNGPDASLPQQS